MGFATTRQTAALSCLGRAGVSISARDTILRRWHGRTHTPRRPTPWFRRKTAPSASRSKSRKPIRPRSAPSPAKRKPRPGSPSTRSRSKRAPPPASGFAGPAAAGAAELSSDRSEGPAALPKLRRARELPSASGHQVDLIVLLTRPRDPLQCLGGVGLLARQIAERDDTDQA